MSPDQIESALEQAMDLLSHAARRLPFGDVLRIDMLAFLEANAPEEEPA